MKFFRTDSYKSLENSKDFCYLSISSNIGNRKQNIEKALYLLSSKSSVKIVKISNILEYPALYKEASFAENELLHYFNIVVKISYSINNPYQLLKEIQEIETKMGKKIQHTDPKEKAFNSRIIDIDILLFKDLEINEKYLIIPHYDLKNRSFFIDLLTQLDSTLNINGVNILEIRRGLSLKNSFLMQIINLNDNSFSRDGIFKKSSKQNDKEIDINKLRNIIKACIKNNTPIIDFGVITTAPMRKEIKFSIKEETEILKQALNILYEEYQKSKYYFTLPKISLDCFRYEVIKNLLDDGYYFDIINDQEGFADERKYKLFQDTHHDIFLMHSLTLPSDKDIIMIKDMTKMSNEIKDFFKEKINLFNKKNIAVNRLTIDPGIGFGKNAEQSIFLLKNIEFFFDLNVKILIGHSRKRFISLLANKKKQTIKNKDFDTSIISLALAQKGIEFLRIHNCQANKKAVFLNLLMQKY